MPYDDAATDETPPSPEHIRYVVDQLRWWLGEELPEHLPPEREDQEAAMRELLEITLRECPADLRRLQESELEALDIMSAGTVSFDPEVFPMMEPPADPEEEAAQMNFFVALVRTVLDPDGGDGGRTRH
jgi:hypothetical protein